MKSFMQKAIQESLKGVAANDGGPFGAVVVRDNKIIASGHNMVLRTNDPSAHAEVTAIRKACKKLKRFDLSDCELFTSCEPCPMCFSTIHWARLKKVFYGATRKDAADIDFDDDFIYKILEGKKKDNIPMEQLDRKECLTAMEVWKKKEDKRMY